MKFRVKKPNIGSFTQKIKNKLKKGEIGEPFMSKLSSIEPSQPQPLLYIVHIIQLHIYILYVIIYVCLCTFIMCVCTFNVSQCNM